jgi:hypothetical protein
MKPSVIEFKEWNDDLVIESFETTGFLVVNNPFQTIKRSLNKLRDSLKYTNLKTFSTFRQGRPSKQGAPGVGDERVILEFESQEMQQCADDVRGKFLDVSIKIFHTIEKFMSMTHNTIAEKHYPNRDVDLTYVKYYKDQEGDVRLGSHCDFGTLTLVHVCDPVEEYQLNYYDQWHIIKHPSDDFIIVNVGDYMQLWTDNRLKSTRHRVANYTKKERSCFITFMAAIPTTRVEKYDPKEWNDFQASHSMATG